MGNTLGTISVYSPSKNYRPLCHLFLDSSLIGNPANSNFQIDKAHNEDLAGTMFYLTEAPSISLGNTFGTNNGAKLIEKVAGFAEGNLLGMSIGEIVQNNSQGGGYVPGIIMGSSSLKVVKEAQKLSLSLKTRIPYVENIKCEKQPYNKLLRILMKLTMPSNASELSTSYIKDALTTFLSGAGGTIADLAAVDTGVSFGDIASAGMDILNIWGTAGKSIIADENEIGQIQNNLNSQLQTLNGKKDKLSDGFTKLFDTLVKSYIYRECVNVRFFRGEASNKTEIGYLDGISSVDDKTVVNGRHKDIKFILKSFSVNQSNQLYKNSLYPLYMDFDISLESLGVVVNDTPAQLQTT